MLHPRNATWVNEPHVRAVHVDSTGLILIYLSVPTERWRPVTDATRPPDPAGIRFFYEVIDPKQKVILASGRIDPLEPPYQFFRPAREGYRRRTTEAGLTYHEIVRYELAVLDTVGWGPTVCDR